MIQKILFATNFTPLSRNALDYALDVAKKTQAQVIGAYSLQVPMPVYSLSLPSKGYTKEMEKISRSKLRMFFEGVAEEGVRVETRLCAGPPALEVAKLAKREQADLIVVAKHSRSTLERFLMASTTERIVRQSRTPVLVVPDRGLRTTKWKPVVCAVDFSDSSLEALRFAIQLANDYRSDLTVIHVLELGANMEALGEKWRARLAGLPQRVKKRMEEILKMFGAPSGTMTLVAQGKPPEIVVQETHRLGSDLLIVGKRGNVLKERFAIGATTNAVLRGAHFPVVVVPAHRSGV